MLTASYSGFVNGNTSLATPPTLATTATTASVPGAYPITVTGGSDANYTITRVNGTLTVADKELPVLTWSNPAAVTYGTALGGTQLNAASSVAGSFSYSPASGTVLHAGSGQTLTATFTPADSGRYATATKTVALTVTKAALAITADNKSRQAGQPNPTFTATYAGFVNGDTAASLDTPVALSTTANTLSPAGTYPITATGAADADYNITFTNGTLTVTGTQGTFAAADDEYTVVNSVNFLAKRPQSVFSVTENDEINGSESAIDGYTLRFSYAANAAGIAQSGLSLVIVNLSLDQNLHVRIFDAGGAQVVDLAEDALVHGMPLLFLSSAASQIQYNPDQLLDGERRSFLLSLATTLSGYSAGAFLAPGRGDFAPFLTAKGGVAISIGNRIVYFPAEGFIGDDSFTYYLRKGGETKSAVVRIKVVNPLVEPIEAPSWGRFGNPIDPYVRYAELGFAAKAEYELTPGLKVAADLFYENKDELYSVVGNNEIIGANLGIRAGVKWRFGGPPERKARGVVLAEGEDGQFLKTFKLLRPGLDALALGQGGSVLFTQEMADSLRTLSDMIGSAGSPGLKAALSAIVSNVNPDNFVNKTFDSTASLLGLDPKEFSALPLVEVSRQPGTFTIATIKLGGIDFTLWKSTSLTTGSWFKVNHAEQTDERGLTLVTDPDAVEKNAYYRIATKPSN